MSEGGSDTHQLHLMVMMGFAGAQPIRPCCDLPVDKSLLAMTLANIVARMERSEIRDSRDPGSGLRGACHRAALRADPLAPSGLQPLTTRPAQVICPSGSLLTGLSSLISDFPKDISVPTYPKSDLELFASRPTEGRFAIVTDVGHGMRWTRQRFARDGIAGRVERLVSDQQRADERCCSVRRSRVVLTPRRWHQVRGCLSRPNRVQTKR